MYMLPGDRIGRCESWALSEPRYAKRFGNRFAISNIADFACSPSIRFDKAAHIDTSCISRHLHQCQRSSGTRRCA